jgi:hypothetical protein
MVVGEFRLRRTRDESSHRFLSDSGLLLLTAYDQSDYWHRRAAGFRTDIFSRFGLAALLLPAIAMLFAVEKAVALTMALQKVGPNSPRKRSTGYEAVERQARDGMTIIENI